MPKLVKVQASVPPKVAEWIKTESTRRRKSVARFSGDLLVEAHIRAELEAEAERRVP